MFGNLALFESYAFLALVIFLTILFGWLMQPFFGVLVWSIVIAVLFTPCYKYLLSKKINRNTSAFVSILLCFLFLIMPLIWLVSNCISESISLYGHSMTIKEEILNFLAKLQQTFPDINSYLDSFGWTPEKIRVEITNLATSAVMVVAKNVLAISKSTLSNVIDLCLILYVSFFFIRDGERINKLLIIAMPFGDTREKQLLDKFAEVTRATVKGSLLIAIAQGALGGVIFFILGISGAFLWGVVMAILSLIPMVGAAIIWLPAAGYLIFIGKVLSGIILIVYGIFIIGLSDNILRPLLIGQDTKLPDYLILLSTAGGVLLWGVNGFITGPLIAVLFITVWQIFIREMGLDYIHLLSEEGEKENK